MKKIALLALATAAAISTPAAAQTVTGTINITGEVGNKCFVLPGAGSTFGGTVAMGELSKGDGTLKDSAVLSATFASVGTIANALSAQVLCTTAAPSVTVTAEPLKSAVTPDAGYTNTVDYTADVKFTLVSTTQDVSDSSTVAAGTAATLSGRLNGTGTNVSVATSNWTASGVLVAATDYTGKITVVIAPGA